MKVELEKIRLAITTITKTCCAGVLEKGNKSFRCKQDVHSDFIKAIIEWGNGYEQVIEEGGTGRKFKITVTEVKQ